MADVNEGYKKYSNILQHLINKHVPIKTKVIRNSQAPYMNSVLRKAIAKKSMLDNRKGRKPTRANREKFRRQRNYVVKLRRNSLNVYFQQRCSDNGNDFWKTFKPFLGSGKKGGLDNIVLLEGGKYIQEPVEVCNVFNEYISSIGVLNTPGNMDDQTEFQKCIERIKLRSKDDMNVFSFHTVTSNVVMKKLRKLNAKKATGCDDIPAKIIKMGSTKLVTSLTNMINRCIQDSIFPDDLKLANVMPAYKAKDSLNKNNYRPISILPVLSKIYEGIMNDQLVEYCDIVLSSRTSAFRKRYSCQHVLLKMVEDWKMALDQKDNIAAIMIDMSKAFDMVSHEKLLQKLAVYGLSDSALKLIRSYLTNRFQRVKIGCASSDWKGVESGVPQGSIIGPLLFNIFVNDIFYILESGELYNYADDNFYSYSHNDTDVIKDCLEKDMICIMTWFRANCLSANPDKFQGITLGSWDDNITFNIENITVTARSTVKALGVTFDDKLNFNDHVTEICRKAARQVNVLKRLHKSLTMETRLIIYRSFILSNFNYCPLVWHFCGIKNTRKMEKIQERALRFVYRDFTSSYDDLLSKGNIEMLYIKRLKSMATEVYKTLHNLNPKYMQSLIEVKTDTNYDFRSSTILKQPAFNGITYGLNSYRYKAPKIWNSLPNNIKNAVSLVQFKNMIKSWEGPKCYCSMCSRFIM